MSTILAVVAHPDDEILGCGGTLAWHADRGDNVRILIVSDGVSSRGTDKAQLERRRKAAEAAAAEIGASSPILLDFPDNRLDQQPLLNVVQAIEHVVLEIQPEIIYTHHAGDLNIDHEIVHRAVTTACRPLPGSSLLLIAAFEVLSSTEWTTPSAAKVFVPRLFVDISATMDRKLAALRSYQEEMRAFPHPRSSQTVRALAAYRGATAGFEAAEAFDIVRIRLSSGGKEFLPF